MRKAVQSESMFPCACKLELGCTCSKGSPANYRVFRSLPIIVKDAYRFVHGADQMRLLPAKQIVEMYPFLAVAAARLSHQLTRRSGLHSRVAGNWSKIDRTRIHLERDKRTRRSRSLEPFLRGVRGCCVTMVHTCYSTCTGRTGGVLLYSPGVVIPCSCLYILSAGNAVGIASRRGIHRRQHSLVKVVVARINQDACHIRRVAERALA